MAKDQDSEQRMKKSIDMVKAPVVASAPRPKITNMAASMAKSTQFSAKQPSKIEDAIDCQLAAKFAFIGAGQGGGRIANAMWWTLGYRRVAAFNTTDADFNGLAAYMPKHSLHVGGAGKDTEMARRSLAGREEEVWDLMSSAWGVGVDCAIVTASLGGGTGSGTAPELVKIARKYLHSTGVPPRVGAIVSLPATAEGFQVCRNAVAGFKALMDLKVSPLIVIDNARINKLYQPPMSKLYSTANDTVSQLLHLFNQLAAVHSEHITFDRSEFFQMLDSGLVVLGAADIKKIDSPADISTAIRDQMSENVLAQVDMTSGDKAACLFVGGASVLDQLNIEFFEAGFTQLNRMLAQNKPEDAQTIVHRGLYTGAEEGLQAYVLVGGLHVPLTLLGDLAKTGGLTSAGTTGRKTLADYMGINDKE